MSLSPRFMQPRFTFHAARRHTGPIPVYHALRSNSKARMRAARPGPSQFRIGDQPVDRVAQGSGIGRRNDQAVTLFW